MIRFISSTTGTVYGRLVKPVLFKQSPDTVHARLLKLAGAQQKLPIFGAILSNVWAYRNEPKLAQDVCGIHFANPVGLSAGFDKNLELVPTIKSVGFGFMTGGSVTYYPCEGNPRPWFYRLPKSKSLVVHVGLANQGSRAIEQRLASYQQATFQDFPLVVSVAKTNSPQTCNDTEAIADYVGSLKTLRKNPRISAFEINISCPNTYGGEPFTTPERLDNLLAAIDALKLRQPVWIKMPINLPWKDTDALLKIICDHDIAAITIGNLHKKRAEAQLSDPLPDSVKGNLSGMPTQKLSDDLIAKTYQKYGDRLVIIGVGGIFTAQDAYRKICLGASLVQLITGMIFDGPQRIGQINEELVELLEKDGFHNISQAIGSQNHLTQRKRPLSQ